MSDQHRTFPIGDCFLRVEPRGLGGAYALACALGLPRLPAVVTAALDREEWTDIVAKARGMYYANPDLLYRFPVCRQHCGCRVMFEEMPEPRAMLIARLVVRLCAGHPWALPTATDEAGRAVEAQLVTPSGALVLGSLSRR